MPTVVIYQTAEDGLDDTVKPRLIEADADCTTIKVIDESDKALSMLDERIEQAIIKENAKVIILDPIQAYVGKDINMNCAIILIGDMNKNIGGAGMNVLEELYHGNVRPNDKQFDHTSQDERFCQILTDNERQLTEFLTVLPNAENELHLLTQMGGGGCNK